MEITTSDITFGRWENSGPRQLTTDVTMSNPVTSVTAVLTGFNVQYSPSEGDHHLGNLDIRLATNLLTQTQVRVTVTFGLRDWSLWPGSPWDDMYEGQIYFAVIGE